MTNIKEMQQALIKQGLTLAQVSGMSEEQLRAACSKKLRESLCGNIEGGNQDQFSKNLQYNLEFSQDGEKIKVAKLLTQTLPSGRKIEAFVDVAGNQYFQYRAADDSIIKEDYFKKAEKIGKLERFQVQDGKLVALNMFGTPKTIYDGEQVFDATMHNEWENKTPAYVINKMIKDAQTRAALSSRPEVTASYTDLMRSIEFSKASKEKQFDMLIEDAGKRFYEANKRGNKEEMAKLLLYGISLACQKIDMKLGITQTKDFVKEYSGLNAFVDAINELVDDGDETNLTVLEKVWEAVKGVGDAADSFIGTQGIMTIAAIGLAVKGSVAAATAAGGAKLGQVVMAAIQAYFGYEGASLVIEGTGDIINAETKEEARGGGAKVGMGGVMLYGTYKSFKAGYDAYKANKIKTMQEQQALMDGAKKVLEIPEGTEITETVLKDAYRKAALKTHPDKGGSVDAFDAVKDAYELLKGTVGTNTNFKSQITKAAQKSEYDANVVTDMMQKYPEVVDKLTTYKAPNGTQLLNAQDISDILYNCKSTIETNPDRMFAVLNNPKEVADIAGWKSRGAGVWRAIGDPLQSTIDANPAIFGAKPKASTAKAEPIATVKPASNSADAALVSKLSNFKGPDGKIFLTQTEIKNLIENCQSGFITDGKPIENYQAKIEAVLNNPEEVASIMDWKSRSAGIWRAIQDPLTLTENANPELFGAKELTGKLETELTDFVKAKQNPQTKPKNKPLTLTELQRKATLDKAGFTEDVIAKLKQEKFSYGEEQLHNTLNMVEYLEGQIANGKKVTPELIRAAIDACDGVYANGVPGRGYGGTYQAEQLEILNKYWSRADEVRTAYHERGHFFTESERTTTLAAQQKATLDKAGFTEDVIAKLKQEKFSYGAGQLDNTLKMVEYLERQIANGKKVTPELIRSAIDACDGIYANGAPGRGYGGTYQDEQLGILARYWIHGKELMEIYK